jgi:hypothetical protein
LTDADKLRNAIFELGLSQRAFARAIQFDERMIRYYCAGAYPVPRVIWLALEGIGSRFLGKSAERHAHGGTPAGDTAEPPDPAEPG